ncbi:MAG: hypothetical protein J6C38_01880 [Oscillospiraceae bacterium]|nr:hypothetical protein [Oscillospiraceae bacterium]
MNNLSLKQYKAIDLALLAVILAVFEAITSLAASKWFPLQLFSLSPTIMVVCIVMMRWGGWAAIHAVVGGLAFCIATGAAPEQYAIYCVGNCAALLALFFFKKYGKERVRSSALITAGYALTAFCGTMVGRWAISLFFGGELTAIVDFFIADSLTLVFTVLVVLIARKPDGLFEDQKAYLVRTEDERNRREDSDVL